MSIDYGRRRTGIAVTDPLRIVATGLTTVPTHTLSQFIKDYLSRETVDRIIVGHPTTMRGEDSESMRYIRPAVERLKRELPGVEIVYYDYAFAASYLWGSEAHAFRRVHGFKHVIDKCGNLRVGGVDILGNLA